MIAVLTLCESQADFSDTFRSLCRFSSDFKSRFDFPTQTFANFPKTTEVSLSVVFQYIPSVEAKLVIKLVFLGGSARKTCSPGSNRSMSLMASQTQHRCLILICADNHKAKNRNVFMLQSNHPGMCTCMYLTGHTAAPCQMMCHIAAKSRQG